MMSQATTPVVGALQFPDLLERFPSAPSSSQMAKLQRNLGKPPKDLPVKRSPIADDPSWTACFRSWMQKVVSPSEEFATVGLLATCKRRFSKSGAPKLSDWLRWA